MLNPIELKVSDLLHELKTDIADMKAALATGMAEQHARGKENYPKDQR
jgi:hypothetical protein